MRFKSGNSSGIANGTELTATSILEPVLRDVISMIPLTKNNIGTKVFVCVSFFKNKVSTEVISPKINFFRTTFFKKIYDA